MGRCGNILNTGYPETVKINLTCEVIEGEEGMTTFRMLSNFNPDMELVKEIQAKMGFHPTVYGGPWGIKTGMPFQASKDKSPTTLITTWYCRCNQPHL